MMLQKTERTLNGGNLRILKILSFIKRCLLLGCSLTKSVTFGTKHFVHYSRHVRYLECPLFGGFTVFTYTQTFGQTLAFVVL